MSLTRKLPTTIVGYQKALDSADTKQDSLPVGTDILNPTTVTRLAAMNTDYKNAVQGVDNAQSALSDHTGIKTAAIDDCRMFTGDFIQVFNLGVKRGKYKAAHRAFFGLDVTSNALPDMRSEADVLFWAKKVVEGDPLRLAAGGLPMANPETTEVAAKWTLADSTFTAQGALAEALDNRRELLAALNPQADSLIRRVWDEVETFYSEEAPESMRANARHWGVVYITEGPAALLTGLVKGQDGNPINGATVMVAETGAKATTNAEGRYTVATTVIGACTLQATFPALPDALLGVEVPEHDEQITIAVGDIILG